MSQSTLTDPPLLACIQLGLTQQPPVSKIKRCLHAFRFVQADPSHGKQSSRAIAFEEKRREAEEVAKQLQKPSAKPIHIVHEVDEDGNATNKARFSPSFLVLTRACLGREERSTFRLLTLASGVRNA